MQQPQRYSEMFPPIRTGAEIVERAKAGERNPGGEKTGLNGFPFLRYVWDRFVQHSGQFDRPMDASGQVFPLKFGKFIKIYSCSAVLEAPEQPLGVTLRVRYVIGSARQLDELEAMTADGEQDELFRERFAAECLVDEDVALDTVLRSFERHMRDPQFTFRLTNYRKAVRRAAAIFSYYDRLLEQQEAAGGDEDRSLTPKQALKHSEDAHEEPLFSDNSRDSVQLLQEEQGRLTASRQSPERSDEHFFDAVQQLDKKSTQQMLARYKPYWTRMLNKAGTSITDPEVYDIVDVLNQQSARKKLRSERDAQTWARFQEILFDEEPRFVLKGTRVTEDMADEIAQEIKCGFHLNELNLGYRHVLTPHFMQIVDWFCTRRANVPNGTLKQAESYYDPNPVWQFTVSERLDYSIGAKVCGDEGLDGLRAQLFQVLVSLEVAWLANQYVHYDLHAGNVFLKQLEPSSRLYDKGLCYKRYNNDQEWYCLEAAVLRNRIVKILDFGRNRMYVPSKQSQDGQPLHEHNQLLFKTGLERYGVTREPNRCWDARRLLIDLLAKLSKEELSQLERHADYQAFCQMSDQVFRFDLLEDQMQQAMAIDADQAYYVDALRRNPFTLFAGSTRTLLEGRLLHKKEAQVQSFFQDYMRVVVWTTYDSGATPSALLDSPFFDALKRTEIRDSERNVIVSFPTADLEATKMPAPVASFLPLQKGQARETRGPPPSTMMHWSSGRAQRRCAECDKVARKRSDYRNEQLDWCGPVCYLLAAG